MARKRFTFWLDDKKPTEADIAETIPELKSRRSFAKTIRDGIRLIVDLRNGNTDVLFELFPLLKSKLQAEFGGASGGGISKDEIRAMIFEATNDRTAGVQMQSNGNHQTYTPPPPNFDDDDLGLDLKSLVKKADGKNGEERFMAMIAAFNDPNDTTYSDPTASTRTRR